MDKIYTRLFVRPIGLRAANSYVTKNHRHHSAVIGHKFSICVVDEGGNLRGVAIMGRPVARMLDDGETLEVIRLVTDGCPNACSVLYGAARRIAKEMGYREIVTYILASEPGTSLKASGWVDAGLAGGGTWDRISSRRRVDKHPLSPKRRWVSILRRDGIRLGDVEDRSFEGRRYPRKITYTSGFAFMEEEPPCSS